MKIVIPGGSGQVGSILARHFQEHGHEVVIFSRNPIGTSWKIAWWDGETIGDWINELEGADVVINLAGKSVNCRYHSKNRALIMDSRVRSTRVIGEAIRNASKPPKLWLQASTATIYSHRFDAPNDEMTGILGGAESNAPDTWRFSIEVAKAWEEAARDAITPKTRKVLMRSAIILSPDKDGIFDVLLRLVRFGLGGPVGNGRQFMSWIHDADFIRSIEWLISHNEIDGAVNIASPNPLPYSEFMRNLRKGWGIPFGLPSNRLMLEIGAFLMQTESELVLKSRRVIPGRMMASGFEHQFPLWQDAAKDLCSRWRANH
jgi:uncharacterized protein (TIGR01777 family)